jgi:uncharacterized protein YbjT (DUF2867 family)
MPLSADSPVSWISHEDLAAYVIEALRRPHLAGQAFDVGGPDALTGHEVAQVLSSVTGRPVTPFQVPLDELAASLGSVMGPAMGAEIATHYGWIQRQPASLFAIDLWPTLAELPVRPTSFADWAAAHDWQQLASRDQAA